MRSGNLRDQIVIEERSTAVDSVGQPVESWSTVATVWADVRHVSGLESIRAGATTAVVKASMRIREMAGLDEGMRVTYGSTVYNIVAVLPVYPGGIDLVCEKVAQ